MPVSPGLWRMRLGVAGQAAAAFAEALDAHAAAVSWSEPDGGEARIEAIFRTRARSGGSRGAARRGGGGLRCGAAGPSTSPGWRDATGWPKNRRAFPPVEAGRYFIHGSHFRGSVPMGRIGLQLDAATAFGTGEHASTRGCLLGPRRSGRATPLSQCPRPRLRLGHPGHRHGQDLGPSGHRRRRRRRGGARRRPERQAQRSRGAPQGGLERRLPGAGAAPPSALRPHRSPTSWRARSCAWRRGSNVTWRGAASPSSPVSWRTRPAACSRPTAATASASRAASSSTAGRPWCCGGDRYPASPRWCCGFQLGAGEWV